MPSHLRIIIAQMMAERAIFPFTFLTREFMSMHAKLTASMIGRQVTPARIILTPKTKTGMLWEQLVDLE